MKNIKNKKICIVISIYNNEITSQTLNLTKATLKKRGLNKIDIFEVPGAFEIPGVISRLIKRYDGFIAIGCVIKGKTNNFDLICDSITKGIMNLSINYKKPIGNALITVMNKKQAEERIFKGDYAARAVVDVLINEPKKA